MTRSVGVLAAVLWIVVGCRPLALTPDTSRAAARVSAPPDAVAGLAPPNWGSGLPRPAAPSGCPHEKEELEAALGITDAESCGTLRERPPPPPVPKDGDQPSGVPRAPHCYCLGKVILVVEHETPKTTCTHIVGISVVAKR